MGVVKIVYLEGYPLAMRLWFCEITLLLREDPKNKKKNQVEVFNIFAAVLFVVINNCIRFSNGC